LRNEKFTACEPLNQTKHSSELPQIIIVLFVQKMASLISNWEEALSDVLTRDLKNYSLKSKTMKPKGKNSF